MIAFHGYDQDSSVFGVWEKGLKNRYTVWSIDLPFQGETKWNEPPLNTESMKELLTDFIQNQRIKTPLSLMGYSLGGNYAMGFATLFPELVSEIWLIAADGLIVRPWFNFLTRTRIGNFIFNRFVVSAFWIVPLIRIAERIGILPEHVSHFYIKSINTSEKRSLLKKRWLSASRIFQSRSATIKSLNRLNIRVILIFGKKDHVIPIRGARFFKRKIPSAILKELNQGHQLINPKNNSVVEEVITQLEGR